MKKIELKEIGTSFLEGLLEPLFKEKEESRFPNTIEEYQENYAKSRLMGFVLPYYLIAGIIKGTGKSMKTTYGIIRDKKR